MHQDKDASSKWLIEHHGDAIVRLAGLPRPGTWKAVHPEVVQPRKTPDGLLELEFDEHPKPVRCVVEIATYGKTDLVEQLERDALLVFMDHRVLPDVVAVILHPAGGFRAPSAVERNSHLGTSNLRLQWRIVELWNLPADDLLAADDVGLIVVTGVWLLPWLLMSRDLRSVQGEWSKTRFESGLFGEIEPATEITARITGTRLDFSNEPGGYAVIDLEPDGRKLRFTVFYDKRASFLGFKLTLPHWLGSAVDRYVGNYTLTESELVLILRGNVKDGKQTPLEDEWRKLYLGGSMDASPNNPSRRVGRRFLIAVAALVLLAIAAVWLLPCVLMPDDLRRMQGDWSLVRIEQNWKGINASFEVSPTSRATAKRFFA
jgi:hypothetical protein